MILLWLVTVAVYARALRYPFVMDDPAILDAAWHFETDAYVAGDRSFWRNLRNFIIGERTMTGLVNTWIWRVGGFAPLLWKSANLMLHMTAIWLVRDLLLRLDFSPHGALLGAAVFALNPVQVSSVAYASGRAGIQAAVFGFLGGLLILDHFYWTTALSYLFAIKSKEDGWLYLAAGCILWGIYG